MSGTDGGAREPREPQEIRIELKGSFSPDADLEALQEWLRRESWYQEMDRGKQLTVVRRRPEPAPDGERAGQSEQGPSMGVGVDDVIMLVVGGAVQPVFDQAFQALQRWYRNRRRLAAQSEDLTLRVTADDRQGVLDDSDQAPRNDESDEAPQNSGD